MLHSKTSPPLAVAGSGSSDIVSPMTDTGSIMGSPETVPFALEDQIDVTLDDVAEDIHEQTPTQGHIAARLRESSGHASATTTLSLSSLARQPDVAIETSNAEATRSSLTLDGGTSEAEKDDGLYLKENEDESIKAQATLNSGGTTIVLSSIPMSCWHKFD